MRIATVTEWRSFNIYDVAQITKCIMQLFRPGHKIYVFLEASWYLIKDEYSQCFLKHEYNNYLISMPRFIAFAWQEVPFLTHTNVTVVAPTHRSISVCLFVESSPNNHTFCVLICNREILWKRRIFKKLFLLKLILELMGKLMVS